MSTPTIGDNPLDPESSQVEAGPGRRSGRRLQVTVLGLCSAAVWWSGFTVWESYHPVSAAARRLRSSDRSQRVAAIQGLTQLSSDQNEEAIRSLIPAMGDPDAGVRGAAAEALAIVGSSAVRSGSEATRAAVSSLLECLKDREAPVRIAAAGALGTIAGSASNRPSGRGSGKSAKPAKGAEAPASAIDSKTVAASLLELLGDREAAVRQAAIGALRDVPVSVLGEPPQALVAATEDESAMNRAMAIAALSSFHHGLDPLIPVLFHHLEHDEPVVRDACSQAMGRISPSALSKSVVPALISGLASPDRSVRLRLVPLLARLAPDASLSVPALIAVLHEPIGSDKSDLGGNATVIYVGPAQEAAKALGRIAPGTPAAGEAIKALTETVRSGPPQRRASAADALREFGEAAGEAVPALIAFLNEAAASKVLSADGPSAARALGRIAQSSPSADAVVTALTEALKSDSATTREAALRALSTFGPSASSAIPAIRALADSAPTEKIREAAADALEKLKPPGK
jgi:HEAT repeat protein